MSVYDVTYETLGHTHSVITTAEDMVEYRPPNNGMESESNFSLTLSSINPEILLEIHKRFNPKNY